MADPRTQVEMTKIPKRTHIDFFVTMVVSSFLMKFIKLKIRKAPKGFQNPLEPK
jgi:hypothetical protein